MDIRPSNKMKRFQFQCATQLSAGGAPPHPRKNEGLTLVELLAVVAVVLIMISLLVPAVTKITRAGQSAKCLSNLRQLAAGCIAYSGEHDGDLVPIMRSTDAFKTWRTYIAPYVGNSAGVFILCVSTWHE